MQSWPTIITLQCIIVGHGAIYGKSGSMKCNFTLYIYMLRASQTFCIFLLIYHDFPRDFHDFCSARIINAPKTVNSWYECNIVA